MAVNDNVGITHVQNHVFRYCGFILIFWFAFLFTWMNIVSQTRGY